MTARKTVFTIKTETETKPVRNMMNREMLQRLYIRIRVLSGLCMMMPVTCSAKKIQVAAAKNLPTMSRIS